MGVLSLVVAARELNLDMMAADWRNGLAVLLVAWVASVVASSGVRLLKCYLYDPVMISRVMARQGVRGPPFIPVVGSAHELAAFEKSFPESMPLDEHYDLLPTVKSQFHLYFPRFGKFE